MISLDNATGRGAPVAHGCVAVAYSGGRDSTALLHATAVAAASVPGACVAALHVHHGLSAHANDWLAHAQAQCAAWVSQGLPIRWLWRKLNLVGAPGDSVEALARSARYKALTEMAREAGAETVLLAHHRRDQAETFLLQALRGGGVAGLSAMPVDAERHGLHWVRPWLSQPREAIEAYVHAHALSFIEDDSNTDVRFARNRMRLSVWPALVAAFEHAEASVAQSASRAADARACLDVWLAQGVQSLYMSPGLGVPVGALNAQAVLKVGLPQQRELLRHWFTEQTGRHLPASAVARITQELPVLVDTGRSIQWRAGGHEVCLYRGVLSWHPAVLIHQSAAMEQTLALTAPGDYPVPLWGGTLVVSAVASGGVALSVLGQVAIRPRQEGADFQLGLGRPSRPLRKQFQSMAVPAWLRAGPFVYAQDRILWAPGLGLDARFLASPGQAQVTLTWVPDLTI